MAWQAMFGNGQATAMLRMLTGNSGGTIGEQDLRKLEELAVREDETVSSLEGEMNKEKQVVHCLCGRREQTFKQSKARRILAECPLLTCGSTKCEALLPIRPEGFIDIVSPTHNFWSHFYKQPDAEESAALQRTRNIRDRGIRILQNQEQARATPPFAEGSRDEVIRLVRANQIAVVWVTSKGAIVHIPTQPLSLLAGEDASFFDRQALTDGPFFEDLEGTDTPQMIVTGVRGLSAVDPEWDGKDLFTCSNPECKQTHNSDWNTHDNLWKRGIVSFSMSGTA